MRRCLVDLNVCLALSVRHHEHHSQARAWFETLTAGEAGLCRVVQLGLVRLLTNKSILGQYALPAREAWAFVDQLLEDERLDFIVEPLDLAGFVPAFLQYPCPTGKLITDAYLAAFAVAGSLCLVTFDRGFRQFKGLDLVLLAG